MAKFIVFGGDYYTANALRNVFNYVCNKDKTSCFIGAQNMLVNNSFEQTMVVNRYFYNNTKKAVIHFAVAFAPDEYISPQDSVRVGYMICDLLPEYQIRFGVHQDTYNLHIHFAINPVSLIDGHKFYFDNSNMFEFIKGLRDIFEPYGFNVEYKYKSINDFGFSEQLKCVI